MVDAWSRQLHKTAATINVLFMSSNIVESVNMMREMEDVKKLNLI